MSERLLAADAFADAISVGPVDPERTREGDPCDGAQAWTQLGETEVGVWEMSRGVATDIEVDEVFVVLSGRGEVEFDDGEVIDLRAGVVVRLRAGEHTVWTVHETLRKVYVAC